MCFLCRREAIQANLLFNPHCLISELGFPLKGLALWWLVLNFWTQHPHRDRVAFNDGFQTSTRWLQYPVLWRETFPPRNCRYPIPRLEEKDLWGEPEVTIISILLREIKIPDRKKKSFCPRLDWWRAFIADNGYERNPPFLKPDQHVFRCHCRTPLHQRVT